MRQRNGYDSGTGKYTVAGSHTYAEEGTYTTTVTVKDNVDVAGTSSTTITGTATITDAPLTGSSAASASANEGASVSLTNATFTDANPGDHTADFTATIAWGDGQTTTGTVSYDSGTGKYTVAGSHTYAEEGTYTTTVTVKDNVDVGGTSSTTITGTATITAIDSVTITGAPAVGQTVIATVHDVDDNSTSGFSYQWNLDGVAISGATSATFAITSADVGHALTVTVTEGRETFTSAAVTAVSTQRSWKNDGVAGTKDWQNVQGAWNAPSNTVPNANDDVFSRPPTVSLTLSRSAPVASTPMSPIL